MASRRSIRQLLVAVLLGVLVGGGLMAVTPAGAEVAQAAATSWKKIWKKELKPLAAKTFYTKKQTDTKYASKAEAAAAAAAAQSAATSAASSATDSKLGGYYKKTESDARYAPMPVPTLLRGTFGMEDSAGPIELVSPISFGATLSAAPITHYIAVGAPVPAGCSGSASAPNASPGHLCVFESTSINVGSRNLFQTSTFGTTAVINPTASGTAVWSLGSWAVRPLALGVAPAAPGRSTSGTNGTAPEGGRTATGSR